MIKVICVSVENYEKSGYGLNMDLLCILYKSRVILLREVGRKWHFEIHRPYGCLIERFEHNFNNYITFFQIDVIWHAIELFFWWGVGWLYCTQHFSWLTNFWCMFGVVWRFKQRTFYRFGSFGANLILACQAMRKWVWLSMNQ